MDTTFIINRLPKEKYRCLVVVAPGEVNPFVGTVFPNVNTARNRVKALFPKANLRVLL